MKIIKICFLSLICATFGLLATGQAIDSYMIGCGSAYYNRESSWLAINSDAHEPPEELRAIFAAEAKRDGVFYAALFTTGTSVALMTIVLLLFFYSFGWITLFKHFCLILAVIIVAATATAFAQAQIAQTATDIFSTAFGWGVFMAIGYGLLFTLFWLARSIGGRIGKLFNWKATAPTSTVC